MDGGVESGGGQLARAVGRLPAFRRQAGCEDGTRRHDAEQPSG